MPKDDTKQSSVLLPHSLLMLKCLKNKFLVSLIRSGRHSCFAESSNSKEEKPRAYVEDSTETWELMLIYHNS